ncbi:hypothetical protein LOC68_13390 [Blastopirellula sp. JC732]|uniref:MORN repeat protein n=1 Tax=Blastopirellula sediminis TaxID=2894196 RepID=A0A9X1MPU0_9BACT|nr:hypothetical protein [Blastopirellula sediminis]MCC9607318.1 hypothetical protein [Blastopirellula sediminis]MCC9629389.1 hypothetical protein [Blastopirellula sediminis]
MPNEDTVADDSGTRRKINQAVPPGRERTFDATRPGIEHGPYRYSYENGVCKFSGEKKDDLEDGPAEGYYPDGAVYWKGDYIEGQVSLGGIIFYDQQGNVLEGLNREERQKRFDEWENMNANAKK